MSGSDPAEKQADLGIAGTKPDRLLLGWDQLLVRPGHKVAPAEMGVCVGPVAVERDRGFVFRNSLAVSVLRAQHLGSSKMCDRAAGQRGQRLLSQLFRVRNISRSRFGHKIKDPGR